MEFIKSTGLTQAWMCDYTASTVGQVYDESKRMLKVNRTESLDGVFEAIHTGKLILPRRSNQVEEFCKHLTSLTKALREDKMGGKRYEYLKIREDHYAHSLNFALLASLKISVSSDSFYGGPKRQDYAGTDFDVFIYDHRERGLFSVGKQDVAETD